MAIQFFISALEFFAVILLNFYLKRNVSVENLDLIGEYQNSKSDFKFRGKR